MQPEFEPENSMNGVVMRVQSAMVCAPSPVSSAMRVLNAATQSRLEGWWFGRGVEYLTHQCYGLGRYEEETA